MTRARAGERPATIPDSLAAWDFAPRCEGTAHPNGTKGHDSGPARYAVHIRCACGLAAVMLFCAGRVSYVLAGDVIECGACGRVSAVRAFWERIEPIDAQQHEAPQHEAPQHDSAPRAAHIAHEGDDLSEWAADLRARACRPKSIQDMTSTMRTFRKRIAPGLALRAVTRTDIVDFLGTPGWAPLTRRTYRTTISAFYEWLTLTGRIPANPAARLPRTRVPYSEPNPLTTEQVQQLLDSGVRRRTRVMILLAAYQGLRASEVAAVHGDDVRDGMLHVPNGKGGTSLYRPLHPLIEAEAKHMPRDAYWFPGNAAEHVAGRSVSSTVSAAMRRAGIVGHRPHQLRAWHATELIRAGVDAVTVQHSMRHATLGTLHKYVHPDAANVRAAMNLLPRIDVDTRAVAPR